MGKRNLTDNEISALQANSCWAEDWQRIEVSDDFKPNFFHRVMFYGNISLGAFNNNVEVSRGFMKHSGVNNATLRNVTIGDNCLIENISGFINNYVIGNDCIISNVCTMETTDGATYGEGNLISVLNEVGEGNLILYHGLTSQVAALMVKHFHNRALKDAIRRLIREEIERTSPEMATIGNRVKIVNTKEITNTVIYDDCEISGASRLSDCTIMSNSNASVYIGTGVICENSIISDGSSIINSVKMQDCFVGEACKLSNGFTAAGSVFSPTRICRTARRAQHSAVRSQHHITRARCSLADSSRSTTLALPPTSPTMPIRWDLCTTAPWSAEPRLPAEPTY